MIQSNTCNYDQYPYYCFHFNTSVNVSNSMITNDLPMPCCLRLAITIGIAGEDFLFFIQFLTSILASSTHGPSLNDFSFFASTTIKLWMSGAHNHRSPSSLVPESLSLSTGLNCFSLKYSTRSVSHVAPFLLLARDCLESNEVHPRS